MAESEIIFEVEESPEGGYEGSALGYPVFSHCGLKLTGGTLNAILTDVASYLEVDFQDLVEEMFAK